jgi:hypothetical protein
VSDFIDDWPKISRIASDHVTEATFAFNNLHEASEKLACRKSFFVYRLLVWRTFPAFES